MVLAWVALACGLKAVEGFMSNNRQEMPLSAQFAGQDQATGAASGNDDVKLCHDRFARFNLQKITILSRLVRF
jgi:hypothetical protein